jgi:hypothetical protein
MFEFLPQSCPCGRIKADSEKQARQVSYRWTVDTNQSPCHLRVCLQSRMDTLCQGGKVEIKRTDDNAGMRGRGMMQPNEMAAIEGDHNPILRHGKREDLHIRNRLSGSAALDSREDIVPEAPQSLHYWEGKVLVGIAPRHRSRRFVGMNLVLDLLPVRTGIGPRIGQIRGPQGGIAPQEVGFTGAQTLRLD